VPALKVGICGEHGGEPSSVEFCHRVGMTYVSCSPYMVPVAWLAAAQAEVKEPRRRGHVTPKASRPLLGEVQPKASRANTKRSHAMKRGKKR
jgi:pyruvate,orthophosphate dikinase